MRSVKENSKKWQWNNKKLKFMWEYKSVKKFICLGVRSSRVQPMVSTADGGKQLPKPVDDLGTCNEGLGNDYAGNSGRSCESFD